jgi:hypothetical protein
MNVSANPLARKKPAGYPEAIDAWIVGGGRDFRDGA